MSIAVDVLHEPHPLGTVNGTEIPDISTFETDEEESKDNQETQNGEPAERPRAKPKRTYSKEELYNVRGSPSTKIRPESLSDKYCNRDGIWDPELWYYSEESEKRSASPVDLFDFKKKSFMDGYVLSPQGRSFARGCQIPTDKSTGGKQNWSSEKQEREKRNKTSGRVGRGWEPRERSNSQRGRASPRNERYAGPGKNRRRADSYDSQPEWFTNGPKSQSDTMELRGFNEEERVIDNRRKKRKKETSVANAPPKPQNADVMIDEGKNFDINEFFDLAENALPITNMYENQIASRFCQWFDKRSRSGSLNASGSNSRRSSITDELAEIAGLTLSSPVQRTPTPDPDFMFAPIIPASELYAKDTMLDQDPDIDVQPLLDSVIPHKTVKGAVNLEDLEGKQVKESGIENVKETSVPSKKPEETDTLIFNKLVETMKASGNLPEKPAPPIPDIPPHLLPRPPSSKDRSRTVSPILSRSPSPLQLLQDVTRQTRSPVSFVTDPRLMSVNMALRNPSPVPDIFSPAARIPRPLTPEELYGVPPAFNINVSNPPNLFEFTGAVANIGVKNVPSNKSNLPRYISKTQPSTDQRTPTSTLPDSSKLNTHVHPVISQSFVPTSVLRKLHKHDQKSTETEKERTMTSHELADKSSSRDYPVAPQRTPLFDAPTTIAQSKTSSADSSQSFPEISRANLMSPQEFLSPRSSRESPVNSGSSTIRPELLTPHHLPLPGSPTNMTPHSLPLPQSPQVQNTSDKPNAPAMFTKQQLLTPRSLPLPQSPLVNGGTVNETDNFGIRPLPRPTPDTSRPRARFPGRAPEFKRPMDMRQNSSGSTFPSRRFPPGGQGQFQTGPNMARRPVQPGLVPNPYAPNLGRGMNVHPTALALALRNQQYQMARAAAVAAATAAVNRPAMMSPAQAAAAAMMLNQHRATASAAALRGLIPQVNPRMFQQPPLRPNLPPALQHQHHVVHRSEPTKESSLSKWFSVDVLKQSQSQSAPPGRGAKVLSVEELERHA